MTTASASARNGTSLASSKSRVPLGGMSARAARTCASRQQPDWADLAVWDDAQLTAESPFRAGAGPSDPGPLRVHFHKGMDAMIAVTQGYQARCGDLTVALKPGDVFLVGMWEPHAYQYVTRAHMVVFSFFPEVLETEFTPGLSLLSLFTVPPSQRPHVASPEMRDLVLSAAHAVTHECQEQRLGYLDVCRAHLLRVLIALRREWSPPAAIGPASHTSRADIERVQPAVNLARARPMRRVQSSEAAAACGLSVSRFHAVFSRTMGVSYGDFCLRARLAVAARLLLDTQLTVDTVAKETAFNDSAHLYHRFMQHYGQAPTQYRKLG